MTEPRRVNPRDIVIMPNRSGDCSPRFGLGRAAQQHDMNDAVKAVLGIHDELKAREDSMKEHATLKLEKKVVEETSKKSGRFLTALGLFEIGFIIQLLVLKKFGLL